jgi:hypothetical protein
MKINKYLSSVLLGFVVLAGCKKDTYQKMDSVCPKVMFTDPEAGSTGVGLDHLVHVTFNEEMDPASFTDATFIVSGSVVPGTISYSGLTATFKPTTPFIKNHTYSGKVTTGVKDLMGNRLQQDYIWTFSTGEIIAPMVIATNPYDFEVEVPLNKFITATFSELMNPSSIDDSTFIVKQGANRIAGSVTYSDSVAYFTPTVQMAANTLYTATITTKARNNSGIAMENDFVWSFTTLNALPPTIVSTDPTDIETGVVLNKVVTANFNVAMNSTTLNTSSFTLTEGANAVAGTVSSIGSMANFTPSADLLANTTYTAKITTEAKSTNGINMVSDYTWSFTTGIIAAPKVIATDPTNMAIGVPYNKVISATFNEAMDPATLSSSTFIVKEGTNIITGLVTYSGTKASFTPNSLLLSGKVYTATITTGAKNLSGIPLANAYTWSFTTFVTPINPTVISTDPLNLATGVELNKSMSATFSTIMNASTLTSATFTLKQGTNSIAGSVSYLGKTAYFNPTVNLTSGTLYTATITTGAKDLAGTPLANNYTWTFTTGVIVAPKVILTDPLNLATNVALNKTISATFSEAMKSQTITTSNFILKQGANTILGTVWYSGTTAFFKPNSNLISGLTYTATITTGAKNTSDIPLANNYVWTFSTKAPLGPKAPDLKGVGRFGIIAGVGVSNNAGFSKVNNLDVGIYPGARSSITGFPPAIVVNGAIYASDDVAPPGVAAMLLQAKNDLTAAYLYAEGASSPAQQPFLVI